MLNLFGNLIKSGLTDGQDKFVHQRIFLVNAITLVTQGFCVLLILMVVYYWIPSQIFLGVLSFSLLFLVYTLNGKGMHLSASLLMINLICAAIIVSSYLSFTYTIYAESENWLFAVIAVTIFLFEGRLLLVQFLLIFAEICFTKFIKYSIMGVPMGRDFVLLIITTIVMCLAFYLFLVIIKRGYRDSLNSLSSANHTKNKLLSILAHDIKSPLSTFEALLTAGKDGIISSKEFLEHQKALGKRFEPLQQAIDGVLEWSKLQTGNLEPRSTEFSPKETIEQILKVYRTFTVDKEIKVEVKGECDSVVMDLDHFKLIMRNLVHNAIKFTLQRGWIKITIGPHENGCMIEVADSGVGMSQEEIRKILDKKPMESMSGTGGEKGTGLGLNMSLELLERNHCSLNIYSEIGGGSRFCLLVPSNKTAQKRTHLYT